MLEEQISRTRQLDEVSGSRSRGRVSAVRLNGGMCRSGRTCRRSSGARRQAVPTRYAITRSLGRPMPYRRSRVRTSDGGAD